MPQYTVLVIVLLVLNIMMSKIGVQNIDIGHPYIFILIKKLAFMHVYYFIYTVDV